MIVTYLDAARTARWSVAAARERVRPVSSNLCGRRNPLALRFVATGARGGIANDRQWAPSRPGCSDRVNHERGGREANSSDPLGGVMAKGGRSRNSGVIFLLVASLALGAWSTAAASASSGRSTASVKSFLGEISAGIRSGSPKFLLSHLNKAVIQHFGEATCRAFITSLHDPTASYVVESVGKPGPFTYATPGRTSVISDVVPVVVHATRAGSHFTATLHVAESGTPTRYSWFTNCADLTTQFVGTYVGTWNDMTFGSSGPITVAIKVGGIGAIGSPVVVDFTLGGNVFGGNAPPPQTFTGTVVSLGLSFSGSSTFFGNVTWLLATSGAFTATGVDVPGGNVSSFSASGSIVSNHLSASFHISLLGGMTANGQMNASRS